MPAFSTTRDQPVPDCASAALGIDAVYICVQFSRADERVKLVLSQGAATWLA